MYVDEVGQRNVCNGAHVGGTQYGMATCRESLACPKEVDNRWGAEHGLRDLMSSLRRVDVYVVGPQAPAMGGNLELCRFRVGIALGGRWTRLGKSAVHPLAR
jgi:hypothetical protein